MSTYKLESWDLSTIMSKDVTKTFADIESRTKSIEKRKSQLTSTISSKDFMQFIKDFESLHILIAKMSYSVGLKSAEDSTDQTTAALKSKIDHFLMRIDNRLLYFDLWFKKLPDEKAKELIQESGNFHYYLECIRRTKPYTLRESEEKIITIKDVTGVSSLITVYDILTSQFTFEFEEKTLNQNELAVMMRDPSAKRRELAYKTLFEKFDHYKDVITEIYKQSVNDWREENVHLRGYKNPIHVRDMSNDLPSDAVKAVLSVCKENHSLFQRYFSLKKKRLGVDKIRRFDVYAPITTKTEKISYDKAIKLVLETFEDFSPDFSKHANEIIENKHIHSTLQKGKNPGAFCATVTTDTPPYILLNYTGTLRDVSTLAHELGHGIHACLASHQTEFTNHATLPLAETASTFAELLLLERLLKQQPESAESLLFAHLDNMYATIIRQASFVEFEIKAHKMIEDGKTRDEISAMYLKALKSQLGKDVEVDDMFKSEWSVVPHFFHTPFYCYAYAFGNLLALALFETYKEEGESFVPKLIDMLASGGSESPVTITKKLGIDICSKEFWRKGFVVIEELLKRTEKLVDA